MSVTVWLAIAQLLILPVKARMEAPAGYALVKGQLLQKLIQGAVVSPSGSQSGPNEAAAVFGADGIYRFFGSEVWSVQTPYEIMEDRVCLPKLSPAVCFRFYASKQGSYMREQVGGGDPTRVSVNIERK